MFVALFQSKVDIYCFGLPLVCDYKPVAITLLLHVATEMGFMGLPFKVFHFGKLFLAQLCMNALKFNQLGVISP